MRVLNQLFKHLHIIESGSLALTTPDGNQHHFTGDKPGVDATLQLHDWRVVLHLIQKGDVGFAQDYWHGAWDSDDLTNLTLFALQNKRALSRLISGSKLARLWAFFSYFKRRNTTKGSQANIRAHYDLGNAFYQLWLDPSMTYSAALFQHEDESLQQAQHNKYQRILDCLEQRSGRLLEIGCGWGGFAKHALGRGDFDFKGITLSKEQHAYAQKHLPEHSSIALEDYRHQQGQFDKIVSIEMFEAVGEQYWQTYFDQIKRLLTRKGKAVIQTITMNEKDFPAYRLGSDFIRSYIFPGGMLPSPERFYHHAQRAGLKVGNTFFFGHDYARTLAHWLHAFDTQQTQVKALGFDAGFIRLWRFYLAACCAAFKFENINVMQVELTHA